MTAPAPDHRAPPEGRACLPPQNTAAMLTTFNEVDMSAAHHHGACATAMALQGRLREEARREAGLHGFFVKACVAGLKEVPAVNAEIDGRTSSTRTTTTSASPSAPPQGPGRAGGA
jgi:pyruvate/2-oxoglutarate dehydrogenase complex dihydrolipoamide acyltransferase (E2) component